MKKFVSGFLVMALLLAISRANTFANDMGKIGVFQTISTGNEYHNVIVKADGSLWTWGNNEYGQLGDGTTTNRKTPTKIMEGVTTVSAGCWCTLAVKTDGSLWAWGRFSGNISMPNSVSMIISITPMKIMDNVAMVSASNDRALVIKTDGSLWEIREDISNPVKKIDNVVAVSAGNFYVMAIKTDKSLWAWGVNTYGQLGDGTTTFRSTPVKIMDNVSSVSAGSEHTLAIKTDGSLWAWGWNMLGQLGDSTTTDHLIPTKIMDNVATVSAGHIHTMAIKTDGSLWAWGTGGAITDDPTTPIKIMDNAATVSAGYAHTIAVKTDGSLWAWGWNNIGQLGDGTAEDSYIPIKIMDGVKLLSTPPAPSKLTLVVNGKTIDPAGADPFIANDRTMVPVRFVSEALGAKVDWDDPTKTVTITAPGKTITLKIGDRTLYDNGKAVEMDTAAVIRFDRTYVPVKYIAETLGMTVGWIEATRTVTLTK